MALKQALALPFFVLALLAGRDALAQVKENLDLPYDAVGSEGEEEDAPEVVTFYNQTLEGESFFYVIDRSGSMMNSGELARAKQEVIKNINEFSSRVKFGIFFFAGEAIKFPASGQAAEANEGMKNAARSFVQAADRASSSCPLRGLQEALKMANRTQGKRKVLVLLGDGGGTCNGADEAQYLAKTLATVTSQNYQRVKINTIGVLELSPVGEAFMRKLASANGGTYTRIR